MPSSSFKNSPENMLTRSSRVLGNSTPSGVSGTILADDAMSEPANPDESTPLINNELQIHQRTAELSSLDFDRNATNNTHTNSIVNNVFSSNYNDSLIQEDLNAGIDMSDVNEDFLDDVNSSYFPHGPGNANTNNIYSYNPFHKQQSQLQESPGHLTVTDDQPQDLESFNTLLGNQNNPSSNEYFEFNQNLNNSDAHSLSKASSIINFTKKINRSVSSKLLNIHKDSSDSNNNNISGDYGLLNSQQFLPQSNFFNFFSSSDSKLKPIVDLAYESLELLPCVFLGLLLNVLDALSYGMIVFPINKPLFADLGPSGLSMFYTSCVVSQLVFSLGGSAFKSAIGSEMIEITPFFHSMAISIMNSIGTDETLVNKDSIVATTVTCYCVSCLLTGLVFFLLGKFKLGQLIGFFPRHILIGSIGGVGYFLVITGIEVTSRLTTSFSYNWETIEFLFIGSTFIKWSSSVLITVILVLMQKFSKRLASFSLLLPVYFITVFAFIHLLIWLVPGWSLESARENGFVFDVASNSASKAADNESWYHFYSLFKFKLVRWGLILEQLPSMLALTFFGMLHVPINVPALAISVQHDDVDLDRELIAHGYSNFISGCVGSIQNYLVYSNSLLFIRSGAGDKRLAGILLAIFTAIIMLIGPGLIRFIPVCVVGSLIFLLGYELLKESLYDSYSKLTTFDYTTIIIIIVTMGLVDFVYGILLGVLIAFISFVIENANQNPVKKVFTGEVARSTIKRNHFTNTFLKNVGSQTLIVKLQGNIFFGSIGKIEKEVKKCFEQNQNEYNFRYLILDLGSVLSVDYTAAEGFQGIKNFTNKNNSYLIVSSINSDSIFKSLLNVGLIDTSHKSGKDSSTQLFHDLNSALEWCENEYLLSIYNIKSRQQLQQYQPRRSRVGSMASSKNNFGLQNSSNTNSNTNYGSTANVTSSPRQQPQQTPNTLCIPGAQSQVSNQPDDYKYNLTESYMNPMSLINNPSGFGSPRQRNIIKAINKSVNEENMLHNNPLLLRQYSNTCSPSGNTSAGGNSKIGNLSAAISNGGNAAPPSPKTKISRQVSTSSAKTNNADDSSNTVSGAEHIDQSEQSLLKLLSKTFKGISNKQELFWKPLLPYLKEITILKETSYYPHYGSHSVMANDITVYEATCSGGDAIVPSTVSAIATTANAAGNASGGTVFGDEIDSRGFFFIIESGLIEINYDYHNQGKISETLVPKTAFGSLGIKSSLHANNTPHANSTLYGSLFMANSKFNPTRNLKITALKDSKIWKLTYDDYKKLATSSDPRLNEVANELLLVEINLLSERFDKITSFILISS